MDGGDKVKIAALKRFIEEQQEHLRVTGIALLEEEKIERGIVKEVHVDNQTILSY